MFLNAGQFEVCQADEAKGGPEQGLDGLPEVGEPPPDQAGRPPVHLLLHRALPVT